MPRTGQWRERIGAVSLPIAGMVEVAEEPAPPAERPPPLRAGCYTLSLRWAETHPDAPGLVGTLRVEQMLPRVRFSGDLYRDQPTADLLADRSAAIRERRPRSNDAPDTGGRIPVYPRRNYHSYLRGIGAKLSSAAHGGSGDSVVLEVEEFAYTHQPGFGGSFDQAPTRKLRFVLAPTGSPDIYDGTAHAGTTRLGTVSLRWVSPNYRHAHLRLHALEGAVALPAEVEGATFATIFADAGWELSVTDVGSFPLPAGLEHVSVHDCWRRPDMRKLLTLVPGFDVDEFDSAWTVHLVAIPAKLGCQRGWMPELVIVHDSSIFRVGGLIYSHDGYPSAPTGDGVLADEGSPHYDRAADQQQHQFPKAYLRSAAHEVGHAFNQIHHEIEVGEPDNSIMTTSPGVARFLGVAGTFPDEVSLGFSDRVKTHLRHLPDPAVRPGAMAFVGATGLSKIPESADVVWPEVLELSVELSSDRVTLGEPIALSWTLSNRGEIAVSAPTELAVESLVARVNVADPSGRITFMRPAEVHSSPQVSIAQLEPGASVQGSTTLFWGWDGFAFQVPGRHLVEVIVLWELAGAPVAVAGERDVFVFFPTSNEENEVAALLLDPEVGKAVALGDLAPFERAAQRIEQAQEAAPMHPANQVLRRLGLSQQPG